MAHDLERLKQRIPLLEYLQRHNWKPCRAGTRQELVGLCPLHQEARPSFYVNARKNLFYCHGCGRGGDLIRFVQLCLDLPFRQSVAHLEQELMPASTSQHRPGISPSFAGAFQGRTLCLGISQGLFHRHSGRRII
jgi:DNA primase